MLRQSDDVVGGRGQGRAEADEDEGGRAGGEGEGGGQQRGDLKTRAIYSWAPRHLSEGLASDNDRKPERYNP